MISKLMIGTMVLVLLGNVFLPSVSNASSVDKFGITELYPTRAEREWFFNMETGKDERFNPQATITKNKDGSWKIRDTSTRMEVYTTSVYRSENIVGNQVVLADRGYMMASNDWKNIEMTAYVKVNSYESMDKIGMYARGGKHNDSNPCEGTSYKGSIYFDGRSRWSKEISHTKGYAFSKIVDKGIGNIEGKWIGVKAIIYNIKLDGKDAVRLEVWANTNGDKVTWTKQKTMYDAGKWYVSINECKGKTNTMIIWGGPIATFRWDNASDVDFKWLSVREIQVPKVPR